MSEELGFDKAPRRYSAHGRETVDRMRDLCHAEAEGRDIDGDVLFAVACMTHALKYADRKGLKGPAQDNLDKERWRREMSLHALCGTEDPRAYRAGFAPYSPKGTS